MIALSLQVKDDKLLGMKALMATLKKEAIVGVTWWVLKSHLFKALMLPTFTYDTNIWGGDTKSSNWKVFERCESAFLDTLSY
jgi:hypothetical protein